MDYNYNYTFGLEEAPNKEIQKQKFQKMMFLMAFLGILLAIGVGLAVYFKTKKDA